MSGKAIFWTIVLIFSGLVVIGISRSWKNENKQTRIRKSGTYKAKPGSPTIWRAQLIDTWHDDTVSTSTGSAISRSIVGGIIGGLPGAIVAAGSAKQHITSGATEAKFLVKWSNSCEETVTCTAGDKTYCKLIKYMELRKRL